MRRPKEEWNKPQLFQPKINAECRKDIVRYLAAGMPLNSATRLAGISHLTANRWLKQGEFNARCFEEHGEELDEYGIFFYQAEAARGKYVLDKIKHLEAAAEKDPRCWSAIAWILEKGDPETFGRRATIKVEEEKTVRISVIVADGDDWVQGAPSRQIASGDTIDTEFADDTE